MYVLFEEGIDNQAKLLHEIAEMKLKKLKLKEFWALLRLTTGIALNPTLELRILIIQTYDGSQASYCCFEGRYLVICSLN